MTSPPDVLPAIEEVAQGSDSRPNPIRPSAPLLRIGWLVAVTRIVPPLVLLGLGLAQVLQLRPMWYDEEYSQLAASVPIGTLLDGVIHRQGVISYLMDVPPTFNGPFYLLLHAWVGFAGDSGTSLRIASLLGAAAAAGVLAELVRRIAPPAAAPWTGLLAGLLVACNPLIVEETTQARGYGWALLALSLCALWLTEWMRNGTYRTPTLVAAGVAALLHWFTIPVLIGFAVYTATSRSGVERWRTSGALALACLPAGLLVGWALLGGAAAAPHPTAVGLLLPTDSFGDWAGHQLWLAVVLVAAAILGLRIRSSRRLLLCWLVIPLALITAAELVRPTYFSRYLIFTLVAIALAGAIGIGTLRPRLLRVGLASLLVLGSVAAVAPSLSVGAREPSPDVIAYLASHQTAGEPIVPADGRTSLDLMTYVGNSPRLESDFALPPTLFTDQTTSRTVWLVRIVLHEGSLPIVPAEQRLIDAGWSVQDSSLFVGSTTDLRVERWTK